VLDRFAHVTLMLSDVGVVPRGEDRRTGSTSA
jgi:hypothetical protein